MQRRDFKLRPKDFEQRPLHVMKSRDVAGYEQLARDVCILSQKYYPKKYADIVALDSRLSQIDDYIE